MAVNLNFLTQDDLSAQIFDTYVTQNNTEDPTAVLKSIESQQIEVIKTKLNGRYDTEAIFNATGTDRHYLIIKILTSLVVYYYLRRNAARKVPSDYVREWEWAMKILEKIKAGKEYPDGLPELTDDNGDSTRIMHGNNSNSDFYI